MFQGQPAVQRVSESYMICCRAPQLVGNFEALRFIEAEEKGKIRQKKAKEEKNQKR